MSASAMGTQITLQIHVKNSYSDRAFYVTITDADIGRPKSLHPHSLYILSVSYTDEIWTKLYGPNYTKL